MDARHARTRRPGRSVVGCAAGAQWTSHRIYSRRSHECESVRCRRTRLIRTTHSWRRRAALTGSIRTVPAARAASSTARAAASRTAAAGVSPDLPSTRISRASVLPPTPALLLTFPPTITMTAQGRHRPPVRGGAGPRTPGESMRARDMACEGALSYAHHPTAAAGRRRRKRRRRGCTEASASRAAGRGRARPPSPPLSARGRGCVRRTAAVGGWG